MKKQENKNPEQKEEKKIFYKVILIGDSLVGKTCLFKKLTTGHYKEKNVSTIGIDRRTFRVKCDLEEKDGTIISKNVEINLTDTAGQERFRSMAKIFYKDAKVVIFVYDITSEPTFEGMKNYWYEQIKINCEKDAILAVVANKNDLYNDQKISDEVGQKFADDIGAIFQSTSALSDSGIGQLFDHIGKKLIDPDYDYKDKDKKSKKFL